MALHTRTILPDSPMKYWMGIKGLITNALRGKVTVFCGTIPTLIFLPGCYSFHYDCLRKAGFTVKNCLVVEKGTLGGIGDLKGSYANNSEWIIFCQKGRRLFQQTQLLENRKKEGTQFHKGREPSKKYKTRFPACWFGEEYPKATYNATWQKKHGIYHPTVKNVEFLSWLIQISSTRKELVFDGFMGTGSTALAALANGRDYLGAEINEAYFKITQKRIKEVFSNV